MIDWKRLAVAVFLFAAVAGCQPDDQPVSNGRLGSLATGSDEVYELNDLPTEAELTELIETWNSSGKFGVLDIGFSLSENREFDLLTLKGLKGLHGLRLHGVKGERASSQVNKMVFGGGEIEALVMNDSDVSKLMRANGARILEGLQLVNCQGTLNSSVLKDLKLLQMTNSRIEFPEDPEFFTSLKALHFIDLEAGHFPYDRIINQRLDLLWLFNCKVSGSEFHGWREAEDIRFENLPIDDAGLKVLFDVFPNLDYCDTEGSELTAKSLPVLLEKSNCIVLELNGIPLGDSVELADLAPNQSMKTLWVTKGEISEKNLGRIMDSTPNLLSLLIGSECGLSPLEILELRLSKPSSKLQYVSFVGEVTEEDEIAYAKNLLRLTQVDPEEYDPEE